MAWFRNAPSIFVGSWEELAFRRRAGLGWTDETDAYRNEFTDDMIDRIVDMGCNHLVLPHTKGYGLKAVGGELDYLRDAIERAHQRDLRIGLYLRIDSVIPEILRQEYPDVDDWLTVGELGRQSYYSSSQTFRARICHMNPAAMQYLEAEMRYAVEEMGADLLHLDGMHFSFYPAETCRCARCAGAYRRWLKQRYPDVGERLEIFGPVDFDNIQMPRFDPLQQATDPGFPPFRGLGDVIRSPDVQSWFRFRWDGELALMRHLRRFIRELNPDVAVSINPAWGGCYNSYRVFTTWAERLLPWVDAVWSEDPLHVEYKGNRLVSRIGTYKTAREHDIPVCNYHWMREPGRLESSLALSAAANAGSLACLGFTIRHLPHYTVGEPVKRKFARWVNLHSDLFKDTRPAGEIALLRHQPSLAWNSRSPWWSAMACEQLLVQMQVPWRMFDALDRERLKTIKTLLLPDAVCLSDEELAELETWIRDAGGRVLVTCATASHNQDLRRRPTNPFAKWIPAWQAALAKGDEAERWFDWMERPDGVDEQSESIAPAIAELGRGRIGLWPQIRTRCQQSAAFNTLGPDQWWPPEQSSNIADFLYRLHGALFVRLQAPPQVVMDHHRRRDGTDLLHLVQVNEEGSPVDVIIAGDAMRNRHVRIHSIDDNPPEHTLKENALALRGLRRYTIVELNME